MATFVPPKINTQFIYYSALVSQADTRLLKSNPTIAAGDFKTSLDGGALGNLGTLPTVTPASSVMVKFTLATTETNGGNFTIVSIDAAGAEWCDRCDNFQTSARQIDDLAFPNVSGRGQDIDASGGMEVGSFQAGALTSAAFGAGAIDAAAIADNAIDAASIAANAITSAKIATDAIGAAQLAADAVTEIQSGLGTAANQATIIGYIDTEVAAILAAVDTEVAAIKAKTDNLPASPAATGDAMTLSAAYDFAKGTAAMTEGYAADGAAASPVQLLYMIWSFLAEKNVSGTTLTVKRLDGSTTAMTFTLDNATPSALTRAT